MFPAVLVCTMNYCQTESNCDIVGASRVTINECIRQDNALYVHSPNISWRS